MVFAQILLSTTVAETFQPKIRAETPASCFRFLQRAIKDTVLRKIHSELKASGTQANPEVVQDSGSTMALYCFFTVTPHQEKVSRLFKTVCVLYFPELQSRIQVLD